MDAFLVSQLAEEHHRDLVGLARAEHAARLTRRARGEVRPWRQRVGEVLVAMGVGVGMPRRRRAGALRQARAILADDLCC
ncbi:MAG: hypothetical protein M3144_08610 [Actinomycetota bacterium]|nr:hypothetical protein [Actinomycetota bacterium]